MSTQKTSQQKPFSVTFGVQYSHTPHPKDPRIHPDGWLVVMAFNENAARRHLESILGDRWSFIYEGVEPPGAGYYPRGQVAELWPGMTRLTFFNDPTPAVPTEEMIRDQLIEMLVKTLKAEDGAGSDLPGEFNEDDEHFEVHGFGGFAGRLDVRHLANDIISWAKDTEEARRG